MKDLFQNYVSTRQTKTITGRNVWKIDKEAFNILKETINIFPLTGIFLKTCLLFRGKNTANSS